MSYQVSNINKNLDISVWQLEGDASPTKSNTDKRAFFFNILAGLFFVLLVGAQIGTAHAQNIVLPAAGACCSDSDTITITVASCSEAPTLPPNNSGVIKFGLDNHTRAVWQGQAQGTVWASGNSFLYNTATPSWYDLDGTRTNYNSFKNRYTIPAALIDAYTLEPVVGQTRGVRDTSVTSGYVYEDGSTTLVQFGNYLAVNNGGYTWVAPAADGGYWVQVGGVEGSLIDRDGDEAFNDEVPQRFVKYNSDWEVDTSFNSNADTLNNPFVADVGSALWVNGGKLYSMAESNSAEVQVYSSAGVYESTISWAGTPADINFRNNVTNLREGNDGRMYLMLGSGTLISHDAGQTSGDFRLHFDANTSPSWVVEANGDIYFAPGPQTIGRLFNAAGGDYTAGGTGTAVSLNGIQKFTQSGGYTEHDPGFRTDTLAVDGRSGLDENHSLADAFDSANFVFDNNDGIVVSLNAGGTLTTTEFGDIAVGRTNVLINDSGEVVSPFQFRFNSYQTDKHVFRRNDGTLFNFTSRGEQIDLVPDQVNFLEQIVDYNHSGSPIYSTTWFTDDGVAVFANSVTYVDSGGNACL